MKRLAWMPSTIRAVALLLSATVALGSSHAAATSDVVKSITISAPRDMGYFAGDLVKVDVDLVVADGYAIEPASLPHPGPVSYWLDLRTIDVSDHAAGSDRRYTLKILYQDFYDALDARPQEIPTFAVSLRHGDTTVTANIPAWTIGVSSLREVAPPIKDNPIDYMRIDRPAPVIKVSSFWWAATAMGIAVLLALFVLAHDRAWWPFRARPTRAFGDAMRRLNALAAKGQSDQAYLDALLILHRGIDKTDGRRVLADDAPAFVTRHPVFAPLLQDLRRFFTASRVAFFGSDPTRSRAELPFAAIVSLARHLASAERTRP